MASSKFIKTRSNYVFKDKHQSVKGGDVFERDFMTISGAEGMSPTEEQYYRSSNFKFTIRNGINKHKKHGSGDWVSAETISLCGATISDDSKIILNPDYESMTDFAYYGSCVDMVRASIVDIVMRFPAELYFSKEKITLDGVPSFKCNGVGSNIDVNGEWYVISNDYGIDIYTENIDDSVENPLRYLSKYFSEYRVYNETIIGDECSCEVTVTSCTQDCVTIQNTGGVIARVEVSLGNEVKPIVTVYKLGDTIYYLYRDTAAIGYHVVPNKEVVDAFYDSLDDFQKVLLNRESKPQYTAVFDTPYETENGFFKYKRKYTWPSTYGWNPDLSGLGYETYVSDLINLATFHDEYDTNNIWRSMTHEAIKNLDWTFTKVQGENVTELENIDSSKVEPILKIYGRQYDDLKRQIDNISKSSTVTLDKKNNTPDYFLDDVLNMSGWETTSLILDTAGTTTTASLYPGTTIGYDAIEAGNEFLRRLKVCTPYLFSMKGTVKGLKSLLGLFGLTSDDYTINEYVVLINGGYPKYEDVVEANKYKYTFMASENDELMGLPLAKTVEHENSALDYVVPWFEKGKKYDGDLYFQSKGGWGSHNLQDRKVWDETVSELKIVGRVEELIELGRYVVKSGDICYVTDITGLSDIVGSSIAEAASHYFIIEDDEYVNTFGEVTTPDGSTSHGWLTIPQSDVDDITTDMGFKIAYLESIQENNKGNNPHTGHGYYDDGRTYIEQMLKPFKPTIDKNAFIDDEHKNSAETIAFISGNTGGTIDNQKCLYFTGETIGTLIATSGSYTPDTSTIRGSLFNPETTGDNYNEDASDSIINIKKLTIDFTCQRTEFKEEFSEFIKNKVLFYLRQMIPATTIFEYSIN